DTGSQSIGVGQCPPLFTSHFLQLVILNHWIRKQITAETMQSLFEIAVLPIDIDLHVFPDSNTADFRHPQVPHGITHCITLRIEHRNLRHDDDLCFHLLTIFACVLRTSAIQKRDYFRTTTSSAPSRRRTLTPT